MKKMNFCYCLTRQAIVFRLKNRRFPNNWRSFSSPVFHMLQYWSVVILSRGDENLKKFMTRRKIKLKACWLRIRIPFTLNYSLPSGNVVVLESDARNQSPAVKTVHGSCLTTGRIRVGKVSARFRNLPRPSVNRRLIAS